jgi:murein DD-endopeptidase MepM/ murein hydrolase activator NlpD
MKASGRRGWWRAGSGLFLFAVVALFFSCDGRMESPGALSPGDPDNGSGRPTIRAPETVDRGGGTLPAPTGDSQRRLFEATPLSEYVFPVISGDFGSMWCVCRSVGTSPHVGQDINGASGIPEVSVAMSNGVVLDVSFDSACGWSVWFEDSHQSTWRYLHLNQPRVRVGQVVARGQALGAHADYPQASCGTGPHLHLERRSPGVHGSPEEFRSCQYGRSSCYYNPKVLIEQARVLRSEREARDVAAAEAKTVFASASLSLSEPSGIEPLARHLNLESGSAVQARAEDLPGVGSYDSCLRRLRPAWIEPDDAGEILGLPELRSMDVQVNFRLNRDVLSFSIVAGANPENRCATGDCIESWQLFGEDESGRLLQILSVPGSRDVPLNLSAERGVCLGSGVSNWRSMFFVLTSSSGAVTRTESVL